MNTWYSFNKRIIYLKVSIFFLAASLSLIIFSGCSNNHVSTRFNQIQVIGSHNSYKKAIQPELLQLVSDQDSDIFHLNYEHLSITEQLDLGLRKLELDIYHDPDGSRYADPLGNNHLASAGIKPYPLDHREKWAVPGFKVFHVQDIDFRSHCVLLTDCLKSIIKWSDDHPNHIPIVITVNVKTDSLDNPESVRPLPFTAEVYVQLDAIIRASTGIGRLVSPGLITKPGQSLNESIKNNGWPFIEEVAGKLMLVLDEPIEKINTYLAATQADERVFFVNVPPDHPQAAFIIANNPLEQENDIRNWVKEGYLVRTRADANTIEAINGDYSRFEAAKRSGAQFISTDYYYKTVRHPDFIIRFEQDKFVRCNPVFEKEKCTEELNKFETWDL